MKKLTSQNFSLYIALSLPILMILFIAASIYLPGLFEEKPTFDFIYYVDEGYNNTVRFSVTSNGKLIFTKNSSINKGPFSFNNTDTKLYYYDVSENKTQEISYENAFPYTLDGTSTSPEGFRIVCGSDSEVFFLFFYVDEDCSKRYLQKDNYTHKLNIPNISQYRYNKYMNFLGWVKK